MDAPHPQESPAAESAEPAPEQGGGGGAKEVVTSVHNGLMQLMDMMGQSSAVDDDDKQKLQGLISGFQDFVEGLGSAPGAKPQAGAPGVAPAMAGAAKVQPAL